MFICYGKKRSHQEGAVQVVGITQVTAVLLMGTGRLLSVLQGVKSLNVTDRSAVALDPPHLANPPPPLIPLSNNDTGQPIAFSHCFIFQPSSLVAVDENFHVKISAKLLTAHGEMFKCDFTQN